jgi:hypothetical protein
MGSNHDACKPPVSKRRSPIRDNWREQVIGLYKCSGVIVGVLESSHGGFCGHFFQRGHRRKVGLCNPMHKPALSGKVLSFEGRASRIMPRCPATSNPTPKTARGSHRLVMLTLSV